MFIEETRKIVFSKYFEINIKNISYLFSMKFSQPL